MKGARMEVKKALDQVAGQVEPLAEVLAPVKINLDQARIDHAARARRDGELVETLVEGIFQLMRENEALRAELAAARKGKK